MFTITKKSSGQFKSVDMEGGRWRWGGGDGEVGMAYVDLDRPSKCHKFYNAMISGEKEFTPKSVYIFIKLKL